MTRNVELFVMALVMSGIGLLSGYAVLSARSHTRDTVRIAHVREIQMALEMYFQHHSSYPLATNATALGQALTACLSADGFAAPCSVASTTPYLAVVPVPPSAGLHERVLCDGVNNVYCYSGSPDAYRIQFELEGGNALLGVAKGVNCLRENGFVAGACPSL